MNNIDFTKNENEKAIIYNFMNMLTTKNTNEEIETILKLLKINYKN